MIQFHRDCGAEVTVVALPVSIEQSSQFGILEVDHMDRLVGFEEKPKKARAMPGRLDMVLSSMGNYIFDTSLLLHTLERDAACPESHDFGRNIIPDLIGGRKVYAYDFLHNDVPGLQPHEERGYWRDGHAGRLLAEQHGFVGRDAVVRPAQQSVADCGNLV